MKIKDTVKQARATHKAHKYTRVTLVIISVLIITLATTLATASGSVAVYALDNGLYKNKMLVRVGFFQFDGYHEIDDNGAMSGYGYDFLQMIAPYAMFDYEYVGYDKSWSEMQEMLENGEIDILTSARKTPERLSKFDFTDHEIGFNSTILTTLPSNTNYTTNDYSTFNGMRVGTLDNNSRNLSLENYAEKNGFTYETYSFSTIEQMKKALISGEIDAMVTSDLRKLGNEIIIDKFDESSFYAMVKHGNNEVLSRLNYAINELTADSPSWVNMLSDKYYDNYTSRGELSLTGNEKKYLDSLNESGEKLTVLIRPERAPYSYFENGTAKGVFPDLLETVSKQYNLPYEIIRTENLSEYLEMIDKGVPDIIFDSTYDFFQAEQKGYYLTSPYHTAQFCMLKRDDGPAVPKTVAMFANLAEVNKKYAVLSENYDIVYCASTKECVNAVLDKKADATYLYVYTALKYVSEDNAGFLIYTPILGSSTSFSIAVKEDSDPILYSVMTRIASNIGEDDIQTAISNNTNFSANNNVFISFLYHNPLAFTGIVVLILSLIAAYYIRKNHLRKIQDKKHAQVLTDAYNAATQANQAKSAFLSNVSHDIRTPMNVIIGMTAIAEANINNPREVSECLSKINISSKHLLSLINEVLDMSKIESGKISLSSEEFNLAVLLDNLTSIMTPQAESKNHKLVTHFENLKHVNVIGDSLRLQQVFINITSNAIKYTPEGGHIEITATELDSGKPRTGKYQFVFKDNGIGMSQEYVQRIFEPFSREKGKVDKIQGTGLGMTIAKNIINMMDGTISVESAQGIGSTFTIMLELKLQEEQEGTAAAAQLKTSDIMDEFKKTDYSDKRILIAEDFEMNLVIIKRILSVTGMQIDSAANGKIAVEMFESSAPNFYDMIFMDICMPEMNGHEASRAIRALDRPDAKTVPIIALTADAFAEDVEKALDAGMNEHLSKPLEIEKVSNVLKKWFS